MEIREQLQEMKNQIKKSWNRNHNQRNYLPETFHNEEGSSLISFLQGKMIVANHYAKKDNSNSSNGQKPTTYHFRLDCHPTSDSWGGQLQQDLDEI